MTRLRASGASSRQALRASGASSRQALTDWPALVLAAGLATRLQPLSSVRAKAALPVAGDVLITRILRRLRAAGIRRVVINLHHRADSITRLLGDGSGLDLAVRYSWEGEILGSAGGPARAIPLLAADRFLIVNGDTLADVDLDALTAQHVDTNALVTMAVVEADPRYNAIVADEAGTVRGFEKREPGTLSNPALGTAGTLGTRGTRGRFHFVGVQAVNASAFAGVSPDAKSETVQGIYPGLLAGRAGAVRILHTRGEFLDIGSPADYLETTITIAAREGRPIDRGAGCVVAADAELSNTILWNDVAIGAGARLSHCIVADGVEVPPGSSHSHCSLVMRGREMIVAPF
jgi:NDP-sugar pyrophosphorylase family protein